MSRAQVPHIVVILCLLVPIFAACSAQPGGVQATLTALSSDNQEASSTPVAITPSATEALNTASPTPPTPKSTNTSQSTTTPAGNLLQPGTPAPSASMAVDQTPATTAEARKPGKYWAEWPLIPPDVSAKMIEVYQHGIELGNDPHAFSTIGDCQSVPAIFMGRYDGDQYELGEYQYLEETIQQFKGSFGRQSITVRDGQSVASALSPAWADPEQCNSGETPIDCEFRLHKPSIVFINLGTNWQGGNAVTHTKYLQKIVDVVIEHGAIPILSSKGDNLEGDYRLNRATAQVAYEDDLPFWNFWRSIRDLPDKGIDNSKPGQYLSVEAWGRRSFTGLQALDAVWRSLSPSPRQ